MGKLKYQNVKMNMPIRLTFYKGSITFENVKQSHQTSIESTYTCQPRLQTRIQTQTKKVQTNHKQTHKP